jgi:hypothetical protein
MVGERAAIAAHSECELVWRDRMANCAPNLAAWMLLALV